MNTNNRIKNFDFLRGLFLIFALQQHFTYYINMWFVEYFHDGAGLKSTFGIYYPVIGKQIKADYLTMLFDFIFTPWVSQIYITMAMFNLAKYKSQELRDKLPTKLRLYFYIVIFFVLENFIVAPNFGQAISIYPIVLWMIILSGTAIVYGLFGIRLIYISLIGSVLLLLNPITNYSDYFQIIMQLNFHGGFEYDARFEYFLTSGLLGFVFGHAYFHDAKIKYSYFILIGFCMLLIYKFFGEIYHQNPYDVLMHEHDLIKNFPGLMYILGMQLVTLLTFLYLENKKIFIKLPAINWVGENSILVFGLHRIIFTKLVLPISIFIGVLFERKIEANFIEVYFYIAITLLIIFAINYLELYKVVFRGADK